MKLFEELWEIVEDYIKCPIYMYPHRVESMTISLIEPFNLSSKFLESKLIEKGRSLITFESF